MLKFTSPLIEELHRFATFARSKNPTDTYDFYSDDNCAVCQFLGQPIERWDRVSKNSRKLNVLASPVGSGRGEVCPTTWGALAKRIEEETVGEHKRW